MRWSVHVEGGPRRVNHAAVPIGDRIFSFGGFCTGGNYKEKKPIDIFVLNTITYRWIQIDHLTADCIWPFQRYGHTVVAYKEDIYLFGGRNNETSCNKLYRFHTNTLKWSTPKVTGEIPGERDGHSACVIDKYMFVFGGYEDALARYAQEVFRLDLETLHWELMNCRGEPPIHRDFHSATTIGKNMFIFGGRSTLTTGNMYDDIYSNKVCYLDTTTFTWHTPTLTQPAPQGRRSHSAISMDNRILIFGGYNGRHDEHKNDLWSYDTESLTWTQLNPRGKPPIPRRRQAMCLVRDKIFLFGGTSPNTGPPIVFTEEEMSMLMNEDGEGTDHSELMDHSDLHVLDLQPTLKTLAILKIIRHRIDRKGLPATIRDEIRNMCTRNTISKPLKTQDPLTSG
eukprot:TRINITY_DN14086_c0_g1_i3.p1 TRINITY_DN14086_c0_g1~~TRINITY_DN14086_c0_g1_i3.p1  ORF type:complete len:430 (-),score=43.45 TRINITY_DN14086_c0_g1_i3:185-1372(-)